MNTTLNDNYPPGSPTPIAVGIDINDQERKARMVWANPSHPGFYVLGWRCFPDLDRFERYWKEHLEFSPRKPSDFGVAVPFYTEDSLGLVSWLEAKGIEVHRTGLTGDTEDLFPWGMPKTFDSAHELALSAAYRLNAEAVFRDIWIDMESIGKRIHHATRVLRQLAVATETPF